MAETTGIAWTDHTFNPWRGCAKVSPGCDHCYAEAMSWRNPAVLGVWGDDGSRAIAAESYWRGPVNWDRHSSQRPTNAPRARVFCASLADVFEHRIDLQRPRRRLFQLIEGTPSLTWQLLTKRPENVTGHVMEATDAPAFHWFGRNYHVWIGATAEDRTRLVERTAHLRQVPAAVRFLSCEPLLEDISDILADHLEGIHWVIVGGESSQGGAQARPLDLEWVGAIVTVCQRMRVPVFVKQMGSRPLAYGLGLKLRDRHGGDSAEWPPWLNVRQFPL